MTPEDLDLTVRLARWMGWREDESMETWSEPAFFQENVAVIRYGGDSGMEEWTPLTRPDHAAEVMAEAVRRGGEIEASIRASPPLAVVHVHLPNKAGAERFFGCGQVEDDNPAQSWCRAVELAVLAAAEGGA